MPELSRRKDGAKVNNSDKQSIRREYLRKRRDLKPDFRQAAAAAVHAALVKLPEVSQALHVGAYLSDGCEVDLAELLAWCLEHGKRVYVPRGSQGCAEYEMVEVRDLSRELVSGRYGLMEPSAEIPAAPAVARDGMVWLIPGVAFDRSGARLGRGKGIYDRLLKGETGPKIGVFYSVQEYRDLPKDSHDIPLDMAVTELEVIRY